MADILFGAYNPSGKLAVPWPRAEGQTPVYYAHKSTGRPAEGSGTRQFHEPFRSTYLDEPNSPAFAFGYGLSYTHFEYTGLTVDTPSVALDGKVAVRVTVKNSGQRTGTEVVQSYVQDVVASMPRPVKELKAFTRVMLGAREARQVCFEVPVGELGFTGLDLRYTVEPGRFKVWVAPDAQGGLEGEFEVV